MPPDRRKKGGRPVSGQLLGECEEHNDLVRLMTRWMLDANRSRASVFEELTASHFEDETEKPGRTAMYKMLKGHKLTWGFINAVADVCTERHEDHARALQEARPIWEKAQHNPTPLSDPVDLTQQKLISALSELAETQKELLQIRQIRQESDQALVRANQMVSMLLLLIGQLESQIVSLKYNLHTLTQSREDEAVKVDLQGSLTTAEEQRRAAEAELNRAKKEQEAALRVSTEATISARGLQEDAQLLRMVNNLGRDENLEKPLPALPIFLRGVDTPDSEDFTQTLQRIKVELDYGQEAIEGAQRRLYGDGAYQELDDSVIIGEVVTPVSADEVPSPLIPEQREEASEAPQQRLSAQLGTSAGADEAVAPSHAQIGGYGPSQVLRITDVLSKGEGDVAVRTVFRTAASLQNGEERLATGVLLERLRDGSHLRAVWEEVCRATPEGPGVPSAHKGNSLEIGGKNFVLRSLEGSQVLREVAHAISLRIGPQYFPRFTMLARSDQDPALLVSVKSDEMEEIKTAVGRVIGRLKNPPEAYVVNMDELPSSWRSALVKFPLWHEGGSRMVY